LNVLGSREHGRRPFRGAVRRTLVEIMRRSDRLQDFKNNPQKYIEQVAAIIQHQMRLFADELVESGHPKDQ
jgi:hypothetical protein